MFPKVRSCLAVSLALGLVAAGTGCGSSSSGSSSSSEKVSGPITLTMWYWGQQEAHGLTDFVNQSIAAYHQLHPNITIKPVLQSTDNLMPNFAAAAKAKKGPDIEYRWGGIWGLQDAWSGNLAAVSDYIPKSEYSHYLNGSEDTYENKLWTAPWYVQPSFPMLYRKDILAKYGITAPKTFPELMQACSTLRSHGITPIAGGVQDGWFGGWLFSILESQSLASVNDLKEAVVGQQKFTDPNQAAWWTALQQMIANKCWNDDIGSLQLYQAQQTWVDGKSAMTVTAGTDVKKFVAQVGQSKVGVMTMPSYANGGGAGKLGSTSQTLGISSWSPYKQQAADFIVFMHTPKELSLFYKDTGALPADDRFNSAAITVPQVKQLYQYMLNGAPYLENFIPTDLDSKANFGGVQLMFAGKETPQQAAQATESDMARIRTIDPELIDNFKKWAQQQ
jgi:raffinose/stachyose/melibiose transport system substrate-binding protein